MSITTLFSYSQFKPYTAAQWDALGVLVDRLDISIKANILINDLIQKIKEKEVANLKSLIHEKDHDLGTLMYFYVIF